MRISKKRRLLQLCRKLSRISSSQSEIKSESGRQGATILNSFSQNTFYFLKNLLLCILKSPAFTCFIYFLCMYIVCRNYYYEAILKRVNSSFTTSKSTRPERVPFYLILTTCTYNRIVVGEMRRASLLSHFSFFSFTCSNTE